MTANRTQARRAGGQSSAQPGTRISCHAALDEAARAPFSKERRMKFAKATKFHRKSGEGLGDGSPRLWSAGGAALPTFGVPHLRRSYDVAESDVPALPGWADIQRSAPRALEAAVPLLGKQQGRTRRCNLGCLPELSKTHRIRTA